MLDIMAKASLAVMYLSVILAGTLFIGFLVWACLRMWEEVSSTLYRHCKAWKDLNDAAKQLRRGRRTK